MTPQSRAMPQPGDPIDLAPFATYRWWTGTDRRDLHTHDLPPQPDGTLHPARDPASGQWHLGLEWPDPRDINQVVVDYAGPIPPDLQVQYWRQNWPTPAPERRPGARRGWIGRDDPWHGQWTTVRADMVSAGNCCTITFDPLDLVELGPAGWGRYETVNRLNEAEHYLAPFRRTLKLRLVSGGEDQPAITRLQAYTPATWCENQVEFRFGVDPDTGGDWSGQAEISNGYLLETEPLAFGPGDQLTADGWQCRVDGEAKGVRLRLLYTPGNSILADGTMVTLRTQTRLVSFLVADLDRGPIYVKDYGLFVTWAGAAVDPAAFRAALAGAPPPIYDRVTGEPEQSLARAMAEIPPLDVTKQAPFGRYVVLGVEAGRQEFALRYNGELFLDKTMLKLAGRDAAHLLWPSHQLRFRFGSGDPPDFRERRDGTRQQPLDGWLPVFISDWLDREIEYRQTAFAAMLAGPMSDQSARRGDEDVVTMLRFDIRNTTHGQKRVRLWLAIAPQEEIEVREGLLLGLGRVVPAEPVTRQWRTDPYTVPCLRAAVDLKGRGALRALPYNEGSGSQAIPTAVVYELDLAGGEAHSITLAIPFVSLTEPDDWQQVAALDFGAKLDDVIGYWRSYVEAGGQVELPDRLITDFHKAVRAHVAINVDKDPVSGMIVVPAGTWAYGACGNEGCWQITMLDQTGHHDRARTYLDTFLRTQGAHGLDGNFASQDGTLQGLDLDAGRTVQGHFAYNTDHGYIMECLANHYRYTGDRTWLTQVASQLVAACDFVIRERERTKIQDVAGQPVPEWGLLPAGHLEDNPEWRYWFAVNGHAYAGMAAIAAVLAEIDHPETPRLAEAAAAYRTDIRAAARRALAEGPVVQLLDGTYIPHIPTRTGLRGREWGWFREAAYGAIHLLECSVFEPDEPEMTWILKDLEDNLFVSRDWGRPVDLQQYWFSHGGVTIQPSLTDLAIDYLRRGQVEHALRALFNHFGASLYPDVRVFTEHPVVELGHGVGPFYKTPDEAKWLSWLRACLLMETGDKLHLAPGAPRAWLGFGQSFSIRDMASFFGPVSYHIEAGPTDVVAEITIDASRPPRELVLHLRRPAGQHLQTVTVNNRPHPDFDPALEIVRLGSPADKLVVRASYTT